MDNRHYTIDDFWKLYSEGAEQLEHEGEMFEHLDNCPACQMKMKIGMMLSLLEDDEILALTMDALLAANKDKNQTQELDEDEDANSDAEADADDVDADDDEDEDSDW